MLPYSHVSFCCLLPINSAGRGLMKKEKKFLWFKKIFFNLKPIHFRKNNRILLQSPRTLKHPKDKKITLPPLASSVQGHTGRESFLSFKNIQSFWKYRWLSWFQVTVQLRASSGDCASWHPSQGMLPFPPAAPCFFWRRR